MTARSEDRGVCSKVVYNRRRNRLFCDLRPGHEGDCSVFMMRRAAERRDGTR